MPPTHPEGYGRNDQRHLSISPLGLDVLTLLCRQAAMVVPAGERGEVYPWLRRTRRICATRFQDSSGHII